MHSFKTGITFTVTVNIVVYDYICMSCNPPNVETFSITD